MRHYQRVIVTPISVFNKPYPARIMSYLSIACLIVGIVLMIISSTAEKAKQLGFIAGGAFVIATGLALLLLSMQSCRVVQSVKYIMMPCCMSETERKILEEQAMARTPMLNGVPNVLSHQQVRVMNQYQMNQEQVQMSFQLSGQVQPNVLVQPMIQGVPQQFVNYQQTVQQPAQITAPVQVEISPLM
ncbi:Hypothetical_protein [Hexamita inflata]|uniref:Hypothetical_protein n=1 Tax=Hexamita inflata TaxID=28002 RepID=A0ABP1GLM6_9EUKA